MDTNLIKRYALTARQDFIAAVAARASQLGIEPSAKKGSAPTVSPATASGGFLIINEIPHPAAIATGRDRVLAAMAAQGFHEVVEQVAYTWFNRFVALRFMEIHGYLEHGMRILSNPSGSLVPEALERIRDLDLSTLHRDKAIELALDGTQQDALFRMVLLAQCQELAPAMPWLFDTRLHEGVDVLLPDGLLTTDSVLRGLLEGLPESVWTTIDDSGNDRSVEIIGWLYQFFISERKDEVIGKVVALEDIPAATQLFTPNWIVQYLVQNSLGRLWLESHPESGIRAHMPYYIEPAEQDSVVQAQLDALVVKGRTPESLKILDPASGSGHILLEAFRLLMQIYLEQGYRRREIPRLIFEHNLVGLDIDDRAAQLAGMSLLFEARQHDRKILSDPPHLRLHAFQNGTEADLVAVESSSFPEKAAACTLIRFFENAKTLGSLLRLPEDIAASLPALRQAVDRLASVDSGANRNYLDAQLVDIMVPLVDQAEAISERYDAVVANPPYMGGNRMTKALKDFAKNAYPRSKADAFAMFIERGFELAVDHGFNSMVTMQSWMFLSSYEAMREHMLTEHQLTSMAHLGARAFGSISGEVVQTTAFTTRKTKVAEYRPVFARLVDGGENEKRVALSSGDHRYANVRQSDFAKISGMPVAYWAPEAVRSCFDRFPPLSEVAKPRQGLATMDNDRFLRYWWECDLGTTSIAGSNKQHTWWPCQKGGGYRKWYGNNIHVVRWRDNGKEIKDMAIARYGSATKRVANEQFYFREGATWSSLSSDAIAMRYVPRGHIFETKGSMCFFQSHGDLLKAVAFFNSPAVNMLLGCLSPTLDYHEGPIGKVPLCPNIPDAVSVMAQNCIEISRNDWDSHEQSWDYAGAFPLLGRLSSTRDSFEVFTVNSMDMIRSIRQMESLIYEHIIDAYGLHKSSDGEVGSIRVTLRRSPDNLGSNAYVKELLSVFIGCTVGRYSLDHEGLIYAHAGNIGFDPSKYPTFPADDDGIIPLTDEPWFEDDATERFVEFVSKAWPIEGLEENLTFVADALGPKKNEEPRDTIRRYLANDFYKDHCQTYKRRPIYWLFSSGKHKAFQCLVYLHRYNADTVGRIRSDYVVPLLGKMRDRLEHLAEDLERATSTAGRKTVQKAIVHMNRQLDELSAYADKMRNFADQRIELDLDDGVKVNIQKFGGKGGLIDLGPLGNLGNDE